MQCGGVGMFDFVSLVVDAVGGVEVDVGGGSVSGMAVDCAIDDEVGDGG